MKKNISVSIGIPAYNEESNIAYLLTSLCEQREYGFSIKEIIVVSDGSSDNTEAEVRKIEDKRIRLIASHERKGKSYRLNQIFREFTGEVLFLIDADIVLRDPYLLMKIIQGAEFEKDGIIGINTIPLLPQSFFEKIISISIFISRDIATDWNSGRNYLSFRGSFLGFDGTFAKTIVLPEGLVNDDAYLYILARQKGYRSHAIRNAAIFFRSPSVFADHRSQSSRYQEAKSELSKYFSSNISQIYRVPFFLTIKSTLRYLFLYPFEVIAYLIIRIITKVLRNRKIKSQWAIAKSTKLLLINKIFFS